MDNTTIIHKPNRHMNKTFSFQFVLLSCLHSLLGGASTLNDIMNTHFKRVSSPSNFVSALVQSTFYSGYFSVVLSAYMVIKKTSYKLAILIDLMLYIVSCTLFFPASYMATYTMSLAAIVVIAIIGVAVVPAIQGCVADMFHSQQLSFLVSMLCFVYVGIYFWRESKVRSLAEATAS